MTDTGSTEQTAGPYGGRSTTAPTPPAPPVHEKPQIWVMAVGLASVLAGLVLLLTDPKGASWWIVVAAFLLGGGLLAYRRKGLVQSPSWALPCSAVYLVASTVAFMVATRQHVLWQALVATFAAAVVGSIALLVVGDVAKGRAHDSSGKACIRLAVIVAVGLGFILWGMVAGNRLLAFEGLLVGTVGLVGLVIWVGKKGGVSPGPFVIGGLAALGQAVVFLQSASGLDLALALGLVFWVAGLTVFKLALSGWLKGDATKARLTTILAIAATIGGVALAAVGGHTSSLTMVIGGLTLAMVGLSAFGIGVVWIDVRGKLPTVLVVGSALAMALGVVATQNLLRVWGISLLVSAVLIAGGMWFVFRGEGFVAIMVIGFVLLWALGDRATTAENDPNPTAASRILALGDSFISGEGASEFFEGTNSVGGAHNECRRAPTAYPYLVAVELDMGLDFFACSGAKTIDILSRPQMPDSPESVPGGLAQLATLDAFTEAQKDSIDAVLVSIGGNDVGFSTIVQACLLPRDCNEREDEWIANVKKLKSQLVTTYTAIREKLPDTPIFAMPYPSVAGDSECGLGLQEAEHQFVVRFIAALDEQIEIAATEAGVHYFGGSMGAFAGHLLCDDDPATNHLQLSPPEGNWLDRYSPGKWIHGSMHPRPLGHRLIADRLAPTVAATVSAVAEGGAANPDPQPPTAAELEEGELAPTEVVDATEAQVLLTDRQWINDELFRTVRAALLPTVALLLGGLAMAAGMVLSGRRVVSGLTPKHDPPAGGA